MNLRNIGTLALILTSLALTAPGQQSPTKGSGTTPSGAQQRIFQDAVLQAESGATLYADDYMPAVKVSIEIPTGKSLTIVGGVFTSESDLPALYGGSWADSLRLVGVSFTRGETPATLSSGAYRLVLEDCYVEGPVLGDGQVLLQDTVVHPGARVFHSCGAFHQGYAGVTGSVIAVRGGVILGMNGVRKPASCGCDGVFLPGTPGLYASAAIVLYESAPAIVMGGLGETVDGCSTTGGLGDRMQAPRTIVLD